MENLLKDLMTKKQLGTIEIHEAGEFKTMLKSFKGLSNSVDLLRASKKRGNAFSGLIEAHIAHQIEDNKCIKEAILAFNNLPSESGLKESVIANAKKIYHTISQDERNKAEGYLLIGTTLARRYSAWQKAIGFSDLSSDLSSGKMFKED